MIHKQKIDKLRLGVESLISKNGYSFTEEEKSLLEEILVELELISNIEKDESPDQLFKVISIIFRFLKFFEIDNITDLF